MNTDVITQRINQLMREYQRIYRRINTLNELIQLSEVGDERDRRIAERKQLRVDHERVTRELNHARRA